MSDSEPDLAFDFEAATAALQRFRKAESVCPWCDNSEWVVPEGNVSVLGGARPGGTLDIDLGFAALAVVCTKCGYTRLHHLGQLLQGGSPPAG